MIQLSQKKTTRMTKLRYTCFSFLVLRIYLDQNQRIARCVRIVSLELMSFFITFQRKKKTKKVVERYWDWELTNETQPIWVKDCLM